VTAGEAIGRSFVICRSASGVPRGSWSGDALARPLSRRGRKQAARAGRLLAKLHPGGVRIACGSAVRERETATLIAAAIGGAMDIRSTAGDLTPELVQGLLDDAADVTLLLVLREPAASGLLALLCDSPGVALTAGALAELRAALPIAPGCATLRWLATPDVLEAIGGGPATTTGVPDGASRPPRPDRCGGRPGASVARSRQTPIPTGQVALPGWD
jgi:phosphohistidine phosphatase SixA